MSISKKDSQAKYSQLLVDLGLTEKEAKIYETLLDTGQQGIKKLLESTPYKRGDLYNILYSLRDKGIIEQTLRNRRIEFRALHPQTLINFLNRKKENIKTAEVSLEAQMANLITDYSLFATKPTVSYFEGIEGLEKIYTLLNTSCRKDILLIRSIYDDDTKEEIELIGSQFKKQIKLGIKTKALTPKDENALETYWQNDKKYLIERRIVERYKFSLPAQIMVWGNSVAICSMRKTGVSTLIEDKDIAQTFKIIFEYIWDSTEKYHEKKYERTGK
ncbi:MAG: hypothetical protein NTW50_02055 [Candidatus Berkelbacteria bacterium]|nr:hypothetical protein [Candidatus Berkelbacteria bacterium]